MRPGFISEKRNNENQNNFDELCSVLCVVSVTPSALEGAGNLMAVSVLHSTQRGAESIVNAWRMVVDIVQVTVLGLGKSVQVFGTGS